MKLIETQWHLGPRIPPKIKTMASPHPWPSLTGSSRLLLELIILLIPRQELPSWSTKSDFLRFLWKGMSWWAMGIKKPPASPFPIRTWSQHQNLPGYMGYSACVQNPLNPHNFTTSCFGRVFTPEMVRSWLLLPQILYNLWWFHDAWHSIHLVKLQQSHSLDSRWCFFPPYYWWKKSGNHLGCFSKHEGSCGKLPTYQILSAWQDMSNRLFLTPRQKTRTNSKPFHHLGLVSNTVTPTNCHQSAWSSLCFLLPQLTWPCV